MVHRYIDWDTCSGILLDVLTYEQNIVWLLIYCAKFPGTALLLD